MRWNGTYKIGDGIVGVVQHRFDVDQFEEDHQFDGDERVVRGSNVGDVVIELIGNEAEFAEFLRARHDVSLVRAVFAVPGELVDPFVGLGSVEFRSTDDLTHRREIC